MAPERFGNPVEHSLAYPETGLSEPAGIPVPCLPLAGTDHGVRGCPGEREIEGQQPLGFCLSRYHDKFEQCRVFHTLAAVHDNVDRASRGRGLASVTGSDEDRDEIVLEHACVVNGDCGQEPKEVHSYSCAGSHELDLLFRVRLIPTLWNRVVEERGN